MRLLVRAVHLFLNCAGTVVVPAVIPSLETLVACLLKALDPRDPNRTQALKEVSATLRVVLKNFPMTAYHKATNRLAVGLVDNTIVLFDLTTSSRLRVFKGHEGRPSCLCFNPDGDYIASYSAQESQARIWQVCFAFVVMMKLCKRLCDWNHCLSWRYCCRLGRLEACLDC